MPAPALKSLADEAGKSLADAERYWSEAKDSAKGRGFQENTERFFAYVTGIVKRRLGLASDISNITKIAGYINKKAGDEWVDKETEKFIVEVEKVMKSDKSISNVSISNSKIYFTFHILLASIPLVLRITEFGYDTSESLNGTITSDENRSFVIPGGTTTKRNAKELWKDGKKNLLDVFERALK